MSRLLKANGQCCGEVKITRPARVRDFPGSVLHSPVRPSSPPDWTGLHGCSPSGGLDWTDPVRRMFGLDGLQSTTVDCQALSKLLGRVSWIEGELETRTGAEREEIVIVQYRSKRYYCKSSS